MDGQPVGYSRDEYWRLQETVNELSATQTQHADRIMRLEKKTEEGTRSRSVWGPSSPFPAGLGSANTESGLNPAAEAFRNFDADPPHMISSLSLDNNDDVRRATAASRANSVRFDESANNHYASRTSIELPTRTGSGMGSHPLSERSLSHRSERGSTAGFPRANSFGLESSRLLGSIHNSPRVSGNPPPGFFVLGPCPSIVRCWLTETFSNDSVLYAAICSGSSVSSIGLSLLHRLGLADSVIEENGVQKVRLLIYLTEARVVTPSSRSASPAQQVPTITTKFVIHDQQPSQDKSIQIVLGSDVLREHSADILFSQDKIMLYDDDRNQLSVPLIRPEDDAVYKHLSTQPRSRRASSASEALPAGFIHEAAAPGIIGQPSRTESVLPFSAISDPALGLPLMMDRKPDTLEYVAGTGLDPTQTRGGDDSKSTTGSERSVTGPGPKPPIGVWANSWRSGSGAAGSDGLSNGKPALTGAYVRPNERRPMKVLRPSGKVGMASASRTPSLSTTTGASVSSFATGPEPSLDSSLAGIKPGDSKSVSSSANEPKAAPTKSNPIGSGSAFGWLSNPSRPSATTK